jgi:cyclopropane-fatty-acyl-phospholipid synthase
MRKLAIKFAELGILPDYLVRKGVRIFLNQRLKEICISDPEQAAYIQKSFVKMMQSSEIAPLPAIANQQHYEVPTTFFKEVLGNNLKYSSCYWNEEVNNLDEAENLALSITCQHADLQNGMEVLELGCGWGSLTLWIASHYPNSKILGISNSASQRDYIISQAKKRNLNNIEIETVDMNKFETNKKYDRIVSVEMFEHMRNYQLLYKKIHSWLNQEGKFFKHIFCHRLTPYEFIIDDDSDWMSQYFFTAGIMPSDNLPYYFQEKLKLDNHWRWSGTHYQKTSNEWLYNMDSKKEIILPIIKDTYGEQNIRIWWNRWRIFFMACAELFGFDNGNQWWVSHYLFSKQDQ